MEFKISHGLIFFFGGRPPPPHQYASGRAPSGKVCVVTSVASLLVWGGGQDLQMYRQKCTYTARASASETYILRTQNTSAYIYNQCILLYLWYGAINDIILTNTKIYKKIYEYASEQA